MIPSQNKTCFSKLLNYFTTAFPNSKKEEFIINEIPLFAITFKKNNFKYLLMNPFGLYIEIINIQDLTLLLEKIKKQNYHYIRINLNPFNGLDQKIINELIKKNKLRIVKNQIHIIRTDTTIDQIYNKFNETRKKHIKRYKKSGAVNVFSTHEKIYFEKYFEIYQDSLKRWGVSKGDYSQDFIIGLFDIPCIKMWVAEIEGIMVSGMICIYYKDSVFDWLAASLINDDFKKFYPAVAIQYEVIKDACTQGYKYVNMGASNDLPGVQNFKDTWGADISTSISLSKQSVLFSFLKNLYTFKKRIWSNDTN